jgi:hypothetical protein
MQGMGGSGDACPFTFNFDPQTFKTGDIVSYRVPEMFEDFPFVGTILTVHDDHIVISPNDPTEPDKKMRATREARPVVAKAEAV